MATPQEIDCFLAEVEKRAFKRALYNVRDEDAALDVVQDSMMKLVQHYSQKPVSELPMLFQRILSNSIMDWFRQRKQHVSLFSNLSDFEKESEGDSFDLLESLEGLDGNDAGISAEKSLEDKQTLSEIEELLKNLPARQREAFFLRYVEDLNVTETAALMGCTEGSVKTHCFRATQTLGMALQQKGIHL